MVPINLQSEFETYMRACYGDRTLPPQQIREVEQAFLSGVHVLNEIVDKAGSRYGTMWLRDALRVRLTELGSFQA